jgi:putative ABC transport system permease protein
VTGLGWGVRSLGRRPLRTALSLAGIAVAAAMLLDMVMLSGGIEKSFSEMLLVRGYQLRLTPKGTLPFDTEASLPGAGALVRGIGRSPASRRRARCSGPSCTAAPALARHPLGYGIQPEAQAIYQLVEGPT